MPRDPLRPTAVGPAPLAAISTTRARGGRPSRRSRTVTHARRCVPTLCGVPGSSRHGWPRARDLRRGSTPPVAGARPPLAPWRPLPPRRLRAASGKRNTSDPDWREIAWRVPPRRDRRRNSSRLRTALPQRVVEWSVSPHPFHRWLVGRRTEDLRAPSPCRAPDNLPPYAHSAHPPYGLTLCNYLCVCQVATSAGKLRRTPS
jgi:hypothetical protein